MYLGHQKPRYFSESFPRLYSMAIAKSVFHKVIPELRLKPRSRPGSQEIKEVLEENELKEVKEVKVVRREERDQEVREVMEVKEILPQRRERETRRPQK